MHRVKKLGVIEMKSPIFIFILALALIFTSGCTIFRDNFEADTVGSKPATSPPGSPSDDRLNLQGSANSAIVIASVPLTSQALKIDRTSVLPETIVECVTGGGLHTGGQYSINFKAYAEADQSKLTMSVRSTSGKNALELDYIGGRYSLKSGDGQQSLVGVYSPGAVHFIHISINMDTGKFSVGINGVVVAADKTFLDASFEDLRLLRFEYVAAILEAFPGKYIVDDIEIKAIIL